MHLKYLKEVWFLCIYLYQTYMFMDDVYCTLCVTVLFV